MILCHATPVSSVKVICLFNQIALPLILYGLELGLHCAVLPPWRRHPRSWGFPPVVLESCPIAACRCRAHLSPHSPFGSEVAELLEEHESSDDIEYHQLLKDYHEAQADFHRPG